MAALLSAPSALMVLPAVGFGISFYLARKRQIRGFLAKFRASQHPNPNFSIEPMYCRLCGGDGFVPCRLCNEAGVLARGGFVKKNTVRVGTLVGTKWTSVSAIKGKWRHFLCVEKKGRNTKDGVAILTSTCGPLANRIRVEIPVRELKNREIWEGGWTTLKDIRAGAALPATLCSACKGHKTVMCPRCDGLGQVGL